MSKLAEIMQLVSKQLVASIETGRVAVGHRGEKGGAVEAAVRQFFRDHLPSSIGVAHGEVIDRLGNKSSQLDVILYDEKRTPILYQDREAGVRVIPVEGVIAVVEVKTSLRLDQVPELSAAARRLKELDRSSYYLSEESPMRTVSYAYGREYTVLPPFYFVFAFDGPSLPTVAERMFLSRVKYMLAGTEDISMNIDMVCILNRGIVAHGHSDGADGVRDLDALASPGSALVPLDTKHALLMFYLLSTRYLLQAEKPPIAIQKYIPEDFDFRSPL